MPIVVEPILAIEWAYGLLSGDATLLGLTPGGVWTDIAAQGATYPRVEIQHQASAPDLVTPDGGRLVWATPILVIKAVDKGASYANIVAIAGRIYELMVNEETIVSGGVIVSCVRDFTLLQPLADGGVQYRTILQQFRIEAFAA